MTTTASKYNTTTWQPSIITPTEHEYIVESLRQATGMMRNLALRYNQDFEDLYQEGYLSVLEVIRSLPAYVKKPRAYIQRSLFHDLLGWLHAKPKEEVSLDAPLDSEEAVSLLDILAEKPAVEYHPEPSDERAHALYAALKRLPLEEQRYLREVYQLNAFEPVPLYPYARNNDQRSRNAMSTRAYKALRRDQTFAVAMGVQA